MSVILQGYGSGLLITQGYGQSTIAAGSIGPGWYASDDALVYQYARPHRKPQGESRRFWMDFSALSEIRAGGTLAGTPTVTSDIGDLTIGNVALDASTNRVYADLGGGSAGYEYLVTFTTQLADGPAIVRSGRLRV